MKNLAPSEELLKQFKNGQIDQNIFKWKYIQELQDREINKSSLRIFFDSFDKDIILCCYERRDQFCHRHIFAEWLGGIIEL